MDLIRLRWEDAAGTPEGMNFQGLFRTSTTTTTTTTTTGAAGGVEEKEEEQIELVLGEVNILFRRVLKFSTEELTDTQVSDF